MCKQEEDVVMPHMYSLPFYDQYMDDCLNKRKTKAPVNLLEKLNSYHPNIKFTMNPVNPVKCNYPTTMCATDMYSQTLIIRTSIIRISQLSSLFV